MKFLLAVGSKEYSKATLHLGAQIAQTFKASLGVVYVGKKAKEMFSTSVNLARDNMSQWDLHHPGIEVLRWAYGELGKLCPDNAALQASGFNPEHIVEEDGRFKMILPASPACQVDLILREGEIIEELREELLESSYDLAIIGGSQSTRRMAHDLIQFLPSSVLVMQGLDLRKQYKILLLVDDSEATKRSVDLGATIAKRMGYPIKTLTVSKTRRFGPGYSGAANWAKEHLEAEGLEVEQHFITGDPVNTFVEFAGDDHIIVMGASGQNPLKMMFFGSKPIKTLERSDVPILIVR
jgi:nucleotide-binding universal stress UspA family protein